MAEVFLWKGLYAALMVWGPALAFTVGLLVYLARTGRLG